ncbi:MAG TPA: SgcJ/EcaC family oxidoreductase [Acetobacteraceae bacterium]|nr:SgcJ/EcaC family oxidoreductase [Acetobacteraceae bacterium]
MNADEKSVAAALKSYEHALNRSDTAGVMAIYAPDAVFMPQNGPTSVGADAIRAAYEGLFGAIALTITFKIGEIRQLAPEWVLARTNSTGTVKIHASGAVVPEGNQELYLFQKIGGHWKMARYCFSTTLPA